MSAAAVLIDTLTDTWCRAHFEINDALRRAQGDAIGTLGLNPIECPYRVIASGQHWRLRDYADRGNSRPLLVVAAPIKRPYIWDLTPAVSAIRYCLQQGFHVYLLEWLPASRATGNNGLDEYTQTISDCVTRISDEAVGAKPFLMGHSLGGTLAAIHAASAPQDIQGLVLLAAPLCFQPETSRFRDALVALTPSTLSEAGAFPGSLLSHMSAMASPNTFIWSRMMDAALSVTDPHALDIHARIERWALDEVPLSGKLVHHIIDWLYRENRFCRGLVIDGKPISPSDLSVPILTVVNTSDEVAPLASVKPVLDVARTKDIEIVEYRGEIGVGLQHLGILVGREARSQIWPGIIRWMEAHGLCNVTASKSKRTGRPRPRVRSSASAGSPPPP